MKKLCDSLYNLALNFMKYFSVLLTLLLFLCSFLYTAYTEDMESQLMFVRMDNLFVNLPGLLAFTGIIALVYRWVRKSPKKRKKLLLFFTFTWYLICGIVLILFSKTVPAADSMSVYSAAAELAAGNTGVIHPTDSYLSYYPQQMGLVAYYEILIRFWSLLPIELHAYHFIKCINVFWAGCIILFQYKSIRILFHDHMADAIYLVLSILHLPLLIYTSFVYGEIPSFALFSIGAWAFLSILKKDCSFRQKLLFFLISLSAFSGSVALRKNTLVLIIAVFMVLLFESLKRKKYSLLLQALIYLLTACITLPCIESFYEHRADNQLLTGVPAMSYFAMGMQEGARAPGWYNGFNFNTYQSTGMDTAATNAISKEAIAERMTIFQEDPLYAWQFYRDKFLTQWSDGTYASLQATLATFGGRQPFFREIYEGRYSSLFREYCNLLQNLIYLGALVFAIKALKQPTAKGAESASHSSFLLSVYLFMIAVTGGFLFHMIWEANSRYIFTYGLLLLPYTAYGTSCIISALQKFRKLG